jgi:hypothetical protein
MNILSGIVGDVPNKAYATAAGFSGAEGRFLLQVPSARVKLAPFPVLSTRVLRCGIVVLCALCASVVNCFSLDREAFTFTNYDLKVQLDPGQHRLGVRGKITLRNDSQAPQKIAVLQISSSLDWRSVRAGDKTVQFVTQLFTSDIDHTGALSEAIVTLPQPVAAQGTVDLNIAYEGVILPDATRLTRIGAPDESAESSDWDQISADFTAVRGVGYVAWYPIATEVANLSEGNSLFDVLGRWKAREKESKMSLLFESTSEKGIFFSGNRDLAAIAVEKGIVKIGAFSILRMGETVPTFASGDYKTMDVGDTSSINFFPGKDSATQSYAELLGKLDPLPESHGKKGIQIIQLANPDAAPFATGDMLLMPLKDTATEQDRLMLIYALAREKADSPQPWISEGLAHLAQVMDIEQQHGRPGALAYLQAHLSVLVDLEKQWTPPDKSPSADAPTPAERSLLNTTDEIFLQNKAMWVWSMLRDMVGPSLGIVVFSYHAPADTSASYMPDLFAKHTQRDLQWFFDDWVYHDRGLPDFKVDSAFPVKAATNSYIVTVTITNSGGAGGEVPVIVKSAGGDVMKRLEVRAHSKAVTRIELSGAPQEIVVNDGSVPESDTTNNVFKMQLPTPPSGAP